MLGVGVSVTRTLSTWRASWAVAFLNGSTWQGDGRLPHRFGGIHD